MTDYTIRKLDDVPDAFGGQRWVERLMRAPWDVRSVNRTVLTTSPQEGYRALKHGELAVLPDTGHVITPAAIDSTINFLERHV